MNFPITDLIPQRPPIVMIDELVGVGTDTATTRFKIQPNNIFSEDGYFTESGMLENIAQTAAAMVGYQCKTENKLVPLGYIAAIKNLSVKSLPAILSTIRTTITVTNVVLDVTIAQGVVEQDGEMLCNCELRILIKRSP